MNSNA